jgi:hypothetical protein
MPITRRQALQTGAALASSAFIPSAFAAEPRRKRIAAVNSVYYKLSHAYHIVGRFAYGYTVDGKHRQPPFDVVRMYNDQYHATGTMIDIGRDFAKKKGVEITETVPAALGGADKLDVDGVLLVCEHGDYKRNKLGQILYPRYDFFEQIVEVFKKSGKTAPVFVDKHLSYDHVKARKMYDTAKEMGFGLMAGSSLPVTWRKPEWAPELGAKIEEAVVCYSGDMDIYGFHALETLQCILERRNGGETGVKSITTLKGDEFWKAWDAGRWSKELAEAALRQSMSRDYGTPKDHVKDPFAFLVEYLDGTRASLLNLTGYVADLSIAVKIAGEKKPQATQFYLPIPPGARFFNPLTWYIEQFFATGKSPYPVERTLLTTTLLDFAHRSAAENGQPMSDKAMAIKYEVGKETFFFRGPSSDE